jgi:hypothetical protein
MQFEFSWLMIRFICGLYFYRHRILLLSKRCVYLVCFLEFIPKTRYEPDICHTKLTFVIVFLTI